MTLEWVVWCLRLVYSHFFWFLNFFRNHFDSICSLTAKSGLIRVGDVQEAVGVLALLVHLAHQCVTLQNIPAIHKEVQRVFLRESNSLSDDEAKLIGGEVAGSQVSKMEKKRVMSDELARENLRNGWINVIGVLWTYLLRSLSGRLERAAFSQMIGTLSGYFSMILRDSSYRCSIVKITRLLAQNSNSIDCFANSYFSLTELRNLLLVSLHFYLIFLLIIINSFSFFH